MTFYRIHKLIYIFYKINKKFSGIHYICFYFYAIVLVVLCHFCVISPTGHKVWKIVFFGKLLSLLFYIMVIYYTYKTIGKNHSTVQYRWGKKMKLSFFKLTKNSVSKKWCHVFHGPDNEYWLSNILLKSRLLVSVIE